MTVKGVKKWEGSPESLPALTLRQGDLFVAAVDAEAKLRWWQLCGDPLTMYYDYTDPKTGRLRGGMLQHSRTSLLMGFPADQKITELKFFIHKWTEKGYVFEPLATVPVNEDALPIQ
ncbi:MAG: hypothetical protein M3430_01190 [Acidobacteriota bacterium]|nr:hypothetical protein [Acidobacteriota bacterium]